MKLEVNEHAETDTMKVISLFADMGLTEEVLGSDPLAELLLEAELDSEVSQQNEIVARNVVSEGLFPDQSMYILEQQLKSLKSSLGRISFYMEDVEDLLPFRAKNL